MKNTILETCWQEFDSFGALGSGNIEKLLMLTEEQSINVEILKKTIDNLLKVRGGICSTSQYRTACENATREVLENLKK